MIFQLAEYFDEHYLEKPKTEPEKPPVKPNDQWTYKDWIEVFPKGIPDEHPQQASLANMMRVARRKHVGRVAAPKGVIGPRGNFIPQKEFEKMTPGQRRGATVGPTCDHYEHDVPGLSDWH